MQDKGDAAQVSCLAALAWAACNPQWKEVHVQRSAFASTDATTNEGLAKLQARLAAHERWSRTPDRPAATAAARTAASDRFERQVDPTGKLAPEVRARLAENARKAYFTRLALRSAKKRARKSRPPAGERP